MTEEAASTPPARPEPRRRRGWRIVRWTAGVLVGLLVVGAIGAYLAFRQLEGNIEALRPDLGDNRPARVTVLGKRQPLNIVLIGSDTRLGQSSVTQGAGGDLSDTTILLHLSADRSRAYGVSIPRDLIVNRPECPAKSGEGMVAGDPTAMFNTAYGVGREGCTIRTIEAMTNIRIDHFAVTTFDGFRNVADALGGVPICMPEAVRDPRLDLVLPEGRYEAKGDAALSYVSLRLGIGDGSDVGRMKRQQAFLAAMVRKVLSAGTLANPFKLYNFLDEATKAVKVDEGLASLRRLADLADDLKDIGLENVRFLTMPIAPYAPDPNRLAIGPGAADLWKRLRHDLPLTDEQLGTSSSSGASPGDRVAGEDESVTSFGPITAAPLIRVDDELVADRYGLCE
jgi:LCP family protein required for cell wall assembly